MSGLGLIGSSFSRMIKQNPKLHMRVTAYDPNAANLKLMLKQHLIDASQSFKAGALHADLIILAGPVQVIINQIAILSHLKLKKQVLITDVGSTKVSIMKQADCLVQNHQHFMGGHPMAGSQLMGSQAGKANLFDHASYFLIQKNATTAQIKFFKHLFQPVHVNFVKLSAEKHDQIVGYISHLPHALAFALINLMQQKLAKELQQIQVGGGLLSTTRIAGSDPTMWTSIFMNNSHDVVEQINAFEHELNQFKTLVQKQDSNAIYAFLKHANQTRAALSRRNVK